jgi:type I restriction enzyme, S subunit
MSEWKTYKLVEIADINPRVTLKQGNEYSFVEMKDLNSNLKYVKPSAKKELKGGSKFQEKDTLFARITPCLENGKICQVKDLENGVGFGSTEFMVFRGKKNLSDTDFIYYLTRTDFVRSNAIQAMTGTSGRQRVEKTALEKIEVVAPNFDTQVKIASILSALDDKIEINLQMNQTLEAMAQAIFKEWFVNFNFPGFDGELVDGLPKGWSMGKLKDVCDIKYGKDHKHLGSGDIPVYGSGGIMRFADQPLYSNHSILIPRKGTLSNLFYVSRPFWSVDTMFYTIIKSEYLQKYLFYLLKTLNLASRNVGSAVPSLTTDILNKIDITIPNEKALEDFENLISSFYSKMEENNNQIHLLTQIRDSILPKLMTGKIEIKN